LPPFRIYIRKGGLRMAGWWVTAIGFVICLGLVGGTMVYFLRGTLDSEDSTRIDPVKKDVE
jgi:hypothetical protein